ncbi:MAG TPA: hypothetical protein VMP01_13445 [Pirellulaceae bacterium]|nr:hypothetical protein [Pirellulaceae bacterium]
MNRFNVGISGLVLAILPLTSLYSQDRPKLIWGVSLNVTAPEAVEDQVTSYISRGLRNLDDVRLTDTKPTFVLSVVILELGRGQGYAASMPTGQITP